MRELDSRVSAWTRGTIFGGFCVDPGYYAGRPSSTSDINTKVLEALYDGLYKDVSAQAAVAFVRMVNNLDDMSASSFAVAFQEFYASGCKIEKAQQDKEHRTRIDAHGETARMQAFGMLAAALTRRPESENEIRRLSDSLKAEFIRNHIDVIPKAQRRSLD